MPIQGHHMPDATETRRYCERLVMPPYYAESAIESNTNSDTDTNINPT